MKCENCGGLTPIQENTAEGLCPRCKILQLQSTIDQLQTELDEYRWIPVSERLPEEGGLYYTFVRYTSMPLAVMFHSKDKRWNRPNKVTHWKPIILPEPALKASAANERGQERSPK